MSFASVQQHGAAPQGLIEDAIEYAIAAEDPETVAELLVEHDREFVWVGRVAQFLGWVRRLPSELLLQHPLAGRGGAFAAVLLARPEVEVNACSWVAERSRTSAPALVAIHRGGRRGDARRARSSMARWAPPSSTLVARSPPPAAGADVLSVGVLASLAHALFFAGDLTGFGHRSGPSSAPTHPTFPTAT